VTHVHIIYAHPSERSFTREVLGAFVGGLDDVGHTHTVSDLYVWAFVYPV
jgi:NAD(P)H dehydrogenase (quinone)